MTIDNDDLPAEIPEQLAEAAASAMYEFANDGSKWAFASIVDHDHWIALARVGFAAVVPLVLPFS